MASEERDQLLANLRRLQLRHAANRIDDLLREAAQLKLGHLGFLARVVDTEVLGRTETATNRRIQEAHFPQPWRIEDYDFKEQPCLDRKVIRHPTSTTTRTGCALRNRPCGSSPDGLLSL